jgi:hypothetical protein
MIVVSNTSPLTNLVSIGRFDLLKKLYRTITIPPAVLEELNNQGKIWPGYCENPFKISSLINFISPHGIDKQGGWKYLKCPACKTRNRARVIAKL